MVSVWLGPWDSNPALPADQADCLTNWHRPHYIVGGKPEGRTQHWRATISRVTATPATPYFSYLSFTNILYHNFFVFSNKELWLYWHSLWTELSLPCRQSYRVCCTTIGLSPYPPFATLRRACVAADKFQMLAFATTAKKPLLRLRPVLSFRGDSSAWQGVQDSNPDRRFWRPQSYRWTNPLNIKVS